MVLSEQDANLFFRLMWSLQHFVNQRLKLVPNCPTLEAYQKLKIKQKLKVRDALYQHAGLIGEFIESNPQGLSDDELSIVRSWQGFVSGAFFIERYLAKHAIFIKGETVYAVVGLFDPFDLIVSRDQLPAYVKAVLLPFKGQVIYDGLIETHPILFGGGITGELRETYMAAKQNDRIVRSLDSKARPSGTQSSGKLAKDWNTPLDALRLGVQKLAAGSGKSAIQSAAIGLVKASLEVADASARETNDNEKLWEHAFNVERALKKVYTALNRAGR